LETKIQFSILLFLLSFFGGEKGEEG